MARHPASDERSVLGPAAKPRKGERFFVIEIAQFLRTSRTMVFRFLRDQGMLQRLYLPFRGYRHFTTARGFSLCVAHFRAIQGLQAQVGEKRELAMRRAARRKVSAR